MIQKTTAAPLWTALTPAPHQYPWLAEDTSCEVAIVGGGITAAMCAWRFAQAGIDTLLVSASPIGYGETSRTSGMMTPAPHDCLTDLVEHIGPERTADLRALLLESLYHIEQFCTEQEDGCGFQRRDCLLYTDEEDLVPQLRQEYSLRLHSGLDVEFLTADQAPQQFTFPMEGGVYTKNVAAQVDPYRLTLALIQAAAQSGARIYENSSVAELEKPEAEGEDCLLHTSTHHTIRASYVILASGLDLHRHCGGLCQRSTTHLMATEPIESFAGWRGNCLIHRMGEERLYLTVTPDQRLLIGGLDHGLIDENGKVARLLRLQALEEKRQEALSTILRDMFPAIGGITAAYTWTARDGRTEDGLPIAGRLPDNSQVAYALCCGDNGILYAEVAGRMLLEQYQGQANHVLGLFSPNREWRVRR